MTRRSGFALVEVLAALALLAMIVATCAPMFARAGELRHPSPALRDLAALSSDVRELIGPADHERLVGGTHAGPLTIQHVCGAIDVRRLRVDASEPCVWLSFERRGVAIVRCIRAASTRSLECY